jgi:hypothetical protein
MLFTELPYPDQYGERRAGIRLAADRRDAGRVEGRGLPGVAACEYKPTTDTIARLA